MKVLTPVPFSYVLFLCQHASHLPELTSSRSNTALLAISFVAIEITPVLRLVTFMKFDVHFVIAIHIFH